MRNWKLRLGAVLVLSTAATVFGFGDLAKPRLVSVDVKVTIKKGVDARFAGGSLASGIGKVIEVNGQECTVRLFDPADLSKKLLKIRSRKSVVGVLPIAPIMPGEEVLSLPTEELRQLIDEYKESYLIWADATKTPIKYDEAGVAKAPGLGYLQAYLQWKHDRSYPNREIDISGYQEIAQRRARATAEFGSTVKEAFGANATPGQIGEFLNLESAMKSGGGSGGGPEDIYGNWEFMGPRDLRVPYTIYFGSSPVNGRANAVIIDHSNANTFYAGGAQGGVWKTTDAGVTWSTTSDGWPLLGVSSLAQHPGDANIILAGTGDFYGSDVGGIGIMRSTNAGATWTLVGTNIGSGSVSSIVFFPENPSIVLASAGRSSSGRVYRSVDAGVTWAPVASIPAGPWSDVRIGAQRLDGTRTIWAASGSISSPAISSKLYKSNDSGQTWTAVTLPVSTSSQNPLHIAPSKANADTAYLLTTTTRKVWKTIDGGTTWTDVTVGFPNGSSNYNWSQGWYDYYINTSTRPDGAGGLIDVVFVGLIDIVMSINGGTSWRSIGGSNFTAGYSNSAVTHVDHHNFTVDPNNPNRCLVATDGGAFLMVYNPTADTVSWTRLNKALGITQFYTLAVHPTNPDYVKGGTQDNSTPHSFGNLIQWQNPGAGDGAGCAINWLNTNFQYNSSQNHGLSKTTNGYSSQTGFRPSFTGHSVPFIGKIWLDKNNPNNLYVNTNYLNRYDEVTDSWSMQLGGSPLAASNTINAFDVATGNSNLLYTGAGNGDLYKSTTFGSTWVKLDDAGGFTNRSILSLSVSPNNANDILIGVGGSGAHLYRCADTSAAVPIFTSVSGSGATGLPNVALSSIARDPWQPDTKWYAATDVGVFQTTDAGATWSDITQPRGLPNVEVRELIANPTTGYLTAATYGRGIWRMKIVPAIVQTVVANPTSVMSGDGGSVTVTIDRPAPAGGVSVPLSSNSGSLVVPASVLIPAGLSSAQVSYATSEVGTTQNVTISATMGGVATANVQVLGTTNYPATTFALLNATNIVGGLPEILASDDNRLTWQIDRIDRQASKGIFNSTIGIANPSKVRIEVEVSSDLPGSVYSLYLAASMGTRTNLVSSGPLTATDGVIRFDITDPSVILGPNGEISITLVTSGPPNTQFTTRVDRVRFRALP